MTGRQCVMCAFSGVRVTALNRALFFPNAPPLALMPRRGVRAVGAGRRVRAHASMDDHVFASSPFQHLRARRFASSQQGGSSDVGASAEEEDLADASPAAAPAVHVPGVHESAADRRRSHAEYVKRWQATTGDPLEPDGGRIVVYRGNPNANLMIIGEAPGEQENEAEAPFVGDSGKLLDRIFEYAGFDTVEDIYVTNVAKRRPLNNRKPTRKEIAYYLPSLLEEIRLVDPSIIILAGSTPLNALYGWDKRITKVRGQWFELDDEASRIRVVMPVFHPSYLLRVEAKKSDMLRDIHAIRDKYLEIVPDAKLGPLRRKKRSDEQTTKNTEGG